ncbi:hypothetical protein [Bartonella sp. CB189]|uniref:hypothetical protein n=1 Tax=Bartonella sp. CB189 TaxID=3112254 RepID=UPI002F969E7C
MVNFNDKYRRNLKLWLVCAIGFIIIFSIIVIGGFYMVKPHLDSFVKKEISRRYIKAETSEVSILGKVNLTHVTVPVPTGISLKIGAISARPPISFIPGTFTLYNVDLKYNNLHVQIPKISLNSVALKEKDATFTSHLLQSLTRIELSSISAPNILLSFKNKNELTEKIEIQNFHLYNFKNSHIHSVSFQKMNLATTTVSGTKLRHLIAKSNAITAHNIDIRYAYSVIFGKKTAPNSINEGKVVTGPISLDDMIIDVYEGAEKTASFSIGKFKTSGLRMKPLEQAPEKLIKAYLNARKNNHQTTEKTARDAILLETFQAITSIDAQLDKVSIDVPQLKATLESFQFKPNQWEQSIPKKLFLSLSNLSIIPKEIKEQDFNFLKEMNFERFDLSGKLDVSYDEKKRALFLNTMSLDVGNIGSGEVSAKIIDIDKRLFSGQKDEIIAAFQDFGITEIGVRYTDTGFIDKLFSYLAKNLNDNQHNLKEELYNDFYLIMTQSPKVLLKNHEKAENISKSLGDFVKNLQTRNFHTLIIKIVAKDNKGITMADFKNILQSNLSTTLDKVNLMVTNEASS